MSCQELAFCVVLIMLTGWAEVSGQECIVLGRNDIEESELATEVNKFALNGGLYILRGPGDQCIGTPTRICTYGRLNSRTYSPVGNVSLVGAVVESVVYRQDNESDELNMILRQRLTIRSNSMAITSCIDIPVAFELSRNDRIAVFIRYNCDLELRLICPLQVNFNSSTSDFLYYDGSSTSDGFLPPEKVPLNGLRNATEDLNVQLTCCRASDSTVSVTVVPKTYVQPIIIGISVTLTVIVFAVLGIVLFCRLRMKSESHREMENTRNIVPQYTLYDQTEQVVNNGDPTNIHSNGHEELTEADNSESNNHESELFISGQHALIIPASNLKTGDIIGQGEFGIVYKAIFYRNMISSTVAVKTLKGIFNNSAKANLIKECKKMQSFNHPNVLPLTGVCMDGGPAPYIVMPFMENGSLQVYLKKERARLVKEFNSDIDDSELAQTSKMLLDMCIQVAKGMEYLSSKRIVHRDLAARNCMIDYTFVIKVADFGLSESLDIYKDYFRQDETQVIKLPVKWLAPECLSDRIFSEKTDVWAYGVTCWEIFSGGKTPYPSLSPSELPKRLHDGFRMSSPDNAACCEQMFGIMSQCWAHELVKRPNFSELVIKISKLLDLLAEYTEISAFSDEQIMLSSSNLRIQKAHSNNQ